jgi:transcriptional regulator with XRE-family HTH domain
VLRNIGQILSDNVQRYMDEKGWTQDTLAERAGVSKGTVQNILYRQTWPRLDQVTAVAKAFDLEPATLYQDAEALDPLAAWELVGRSLRAANGLSEIKRNAINALTALKDSQVDDLLPMLRAAAGLVDPVVNRHQGTQKK